MTTFNLSLKSERQLSPEPFVVAILRWFREQRQAIYDLIGLFILFILTFIVLINTNFTEAFFAFTRKYEALNLDDMLVVLSIVLAIYLPIFALRRWTESTKRLHQANTDSLTGLFNRRKGRETLALEIVRAQRHHRPLSIIFFDIDHFKEINDKHGHLVGDRILRQVAKVVLEKVRSIDTLARWGGEEFMLISPETGRDEACQVAERLRQNIEQRFVRNPIRVTASFGIAQLQENDDLNALYRRADDKLYEAKSAGRNRVA